MAAGILPRGKQVRSDKAVQAAHRFGQSLKRLGFDVTKHFPFSWGNRAVKEGLKAGPEKFARWFAGGQHFDDGRPNRNVSFVRTPLGLVVYRMAGPRGKTARVITFYDGMPPGAQPKPAPRMVGGRAVR